jgi:hypothetical protein
MRAAALLGTVLMFDAMRPPAKRELYAMRGAHRDPSQPVTVVVPWISRRGRPLNREQRRAIKHARVAAGKATWQREGA